MGIEKNQSDLSEVKDQLSLDFADSVYLNTISNNLGVKRPPFGFSDDTWRALVKSIALDYKQIANKFRDILSIIYKPRFTLAGTLATAASVGDNIIFLNNTKEFPQLGTIILDDGLSTEETVDYCYIDRESNALFINSFLQYDHVAYDDDVERPVIVYNSTDTRLALPSTDLFPTSNYPYPVVIDRKTKQQETLWVIDNDTTKGILTLLTSFQNSHEPLRATVIKDETSRDYAANSIILPLEDSTRFPSTGTVLTNSSTSFTVSSATAFSVTLGSPLFTSNSHIRNIVKFDGNITSSLANVEVEVIDNTTDTLTFFENLPATPASGDTFKIRPRVTYKRNDYDNNALLLNKPIDDVDIVANTPVELLNTTLTVAFCPVKSVGGYWDVIQAQPRLVELLLPEDLEELANIRSASYIHTTEISPVPSTTLSSGASAGDASLSVGSTSDFPLVGVVSIDPTGVDEHVGYYVSSSTELTLATGTLNNSHSSGATVELFQPTYTSVDTLIGDFNRITDTFPGPYVFNIPDPAPTSVASGIKELANLVSGPTQLAIGQEVNRTALEVFNAKAFEKTNFPYEIIIGENTGNKEILDVSDVDFRERVSTTVSVLAPVGSTSITVTSLSGGAAGDAADFPDANGYRILVDENTAEEEVCYVTSINSGSSILNLEDSTTQEHDVGSTVRLMSDVLTVNPMSDDHIGATPRSYRSTVRNSSALYPLITQSSLNSSELIQPKHSGFDLDDVTGLDPNGGRLIFNFAGNQIKVEDSLSTSEAVGSTVLQLNDSSSFPTVYPYIITINRGSSISEVALVTNNDTGLNQLTINDGTFGLLNTQDSGTTIEWLPGSQEVISYDEINVVTLRFSPDIVLQSTHSPSEIAINSTVDSDPKENGFDYPLRLPPDSSTLLDFILDLIRAAGVQVKVISQR